MASPVCRLDARQIIPLARTIRFEHDTAID
jgi:hypothetical protein